MPKSSAESLRLLAPNGQYLENIDFLEDKMAIINMLNYNTSQIIQGVRPNSELLGMDIPTINIEGMTIGNIVLTDVLIILGNGTVILA